MKDPIFRTQIPRSALTACLSLLLCTGCTLSGGPGIGSFLALALALLIGLFSGACRAVEDDDTLDQFLVRWFLRKETTGRVCATSRDYTRSFDFAGVDPAAAGFGYKISGENTSHGFGESVAAAGDFNGDGFGDTLISAPYYATDRGAVYVIFGKSGDPVNLDLSSGFAASDAIRITGPTGGFLGQKIDSVDSVGDMNGDGFDDILIGAYSSDLGVANAGSAWLIYGSASPSNLDLTSLSSADGSRFDGSVTGDYAGWSVAGTGDVNGDGIDDFMIGEPYYNNVGNEGRAFVVYGKTAGYPATTTLSSMSSGDGFDVVGPTAGFQYLGLAVGRGGDFNGDGIDDILAASDSQNDGYGWVVYGQSGTRSTFNLSTAIASGDGFYVAGNTGSATARSLSRAGDFNGDGQADFVLGIRDYTGADGAAALVYGNAGNVADVSAISSSQGFVLAGASGDRIESVQGGEDLNADGRPDLIVGARQANSNTGKVYVVFGRSTDLITQSLDNHTAGSLGFQLTGAATSDFFGHSVSFLDDVNGDLCTDMIIGTSSSGTPASAAYVVYGGKAL